MPGSIIFPVTAAHPPTGGKAPGMAPIMILNAVFYEERVSEHT